MNISRWLRWRSHAEIDEEIDAHLDLQVQTHLDRGLTLAEAQRVSPVINDSLEPHECAGIVVALLHGGHVAETLARSELCLALGPFHGQAIARVIQQRSGDTLLVDHGSLYPALQRLERSGLITSEWGTSENNRRARFYTLTRAGRKRLVSETRRWEATVRVISRVLNPRRAT